MIAFSWIPPLHVCFKVFQRKSVIQTFSSWVLGSFRKCHSVCLPHADTATNAYYSQQFPPSIIYLTSNTWKYHLCSCLCCARHHLHLCPLPSSQPAQHLLLCAAVTEWILWLQQVHQQDSNQKLTLARPYFCLMILPRLDWCSVETTGTASPLGWSSRYDIFHCSWIPPRISPVSRLQSRAMLTCNVAS